jgi:hypothetical protein
MGLALDIYSPSPWPVDPLAPARVLYLHSVPCSLCQRALQPNNGWLLFTTTFSAADTALLDRVCTAADRAVAAHEPRGASGRPGSVIATVRGRERARSEFQPSGSPGALSKPTAMIPLDRFGDNLDMHAAPCAGVRWHNPLTLAGSMHSVRPVTTGGAPRRAGAGGLAETTDRCDTATWSVQVTGSKSHTFQLILVAQAQPAPRLDLITLPSEPSAGPRTSAHGGAWMAVVQSPEIAGTTGSSTTTSGRSELPAHLPQIS